MAKTKKSSQHELNLEDNQNNNIKKKDGSMKYIFEWCVIYIIRYNNIN